MRQLSSGASHEKSHPDSEAREKTALYVMYKCFEHWNISPCFTLLDKVTQKSVVPKTNSRKHFWMQLLRHTTLQLTVAIQMANSKCLDSWQWLRLRMKRLKYNKHGHDNEVVMATQNTLTFTPSIQAELHEIKDILIAIITRLDDLEVEQFHSEEEKIHLKQWRGWF